MKNKINKKQLKLICQIFGNQKDIQMLQKGKKFNIAEYYPIGADFNFPSAFDGYVDVRLDTYKELTDCQLQLSINQYLTYLHYRFYTLDPGMFSSQEQSLAIITQWVFEHTHPSGHASKPLEIDRIKLVSIYNLIMEQFENVC